MKYMINDTWHSGNTVRWDPEISQNTYSIEPGKVWVAQLFFLDSGTSHNWESLAELSLSCPQICQRLIDFSRLYIARF